MVPLALALAVHGVSLGFPFLSDDYLVVHYLDRDLDAVRWDRVLAEFVQPWFGVRDLYRPMVSLSLGCNLALGGADPLGFHLFNVLCIAVAGAAVAATVRLVWRDAPAWVAASCGSLLVLHPAVVEPATWVAARTTGLELLFGTLALAAWAAHLRNGARRGIALLLLACALCSKEGAMALPAALLAVDLVARPADGLRVRVARHLPCWLLLAAFLCWRKLLLGVFTTAETGHGVGSAVAGVLGHAGWLAWVPGPGGPVLAFASLLLLATAAVRAPRACAVLTVAVLLALLPAAHVASPTPWEGRLVAGALPLACLLPGLGLAHAGSRLSTLPAWGAGAVALAAALASSLHVQGWYRTAAQGVERATAALHQALAAADPVRPFGIASLAPGPTTIQVLQPKATFLLAQRPFAARDRAVCGLSTALVPGPAGTPEALRAVLDAGGPVVSWDDATQQLRARTVSSGPRSVGSRRTGDLGFEPVEPVGSLEVSWVEVRLPGAAPSVELAFVGELGGIASIGPLQASAAGGATVFALDVTRSLGAVVRGELGLPFPTVEVRVAGGPAPSGTLVTLHRLPQALELVAPLVGREVDRGELGAALVPPAGGLDLELLLLLPHTTVRVPVPAGQRLQLTEEALGQLRYVLDLATPQTVHYCFQSARGAPVVARTPLDSFVVR